MNTNVKFCSQNQRQCVIWTILSFWKILDIPWKYGNIMAQNSQKEKTFE